MESKPTPPTQLLLRRRTGVRASKSRSYAYEHETNHAFMLPGYDADRFTLQDLQERANIQANARTASVSEAAKVTAETVAVVSKEYADSFDVFQDHKFTNLLSYLRVFFSGVNQVFARTDTNRLDLRLVIVAVVVLTEDTEIMAEKHPTDKELVSARTPGALNHFIDLNRHIFDGADVAVYLSKQKFARQELLGSSHEILKGMAYLGAACTRKCGALVYDDFEAGWNIAAHEMLHL
ncbi:hypothetical protein MTO96_033100 [Rhipicephalus appendiculatus]